MICIIAGNALEAERFARAQFWDRSEWFYPVDTDDLKAKSNFHVIVCGTAGQNVPESYFNKLLAFAQERGRLNRR